MHLKVNVTNNIEALRAALLALPGMTPEKVEAAVKSAMKDVREPARKTVADTLLNGVSKIVEKAPAAFTDALGILGDDNIVLEIVVKAGKVETVGVRQSTRVSRSTGGAEGKRPTLVADGKEYDSYAALCRAYDVSVNGDSARRAYEKARAKNGLPAVEEIAADEEAEG